MYGSGPLSGEVIEINTKLDVNPELVNTDPFGDGWMVRIKLSNPAEVDSLMDAKSYAAHTA